MGHAHGQKGGLRGALRSVPDIFPIADWTFRTVRQYAMRVHLKPLRNIWRQRILPAAREAIKLGSNKLGLLIFNSAGPDAFIANIGKMADIKVVCFSRQQGFVAPAGEFRCRFCCILGAVP